MMRDATHCIRAPRRARATEIQRRPERKTGELLDEEKLNGGDRKSLSSDSRVKLGDLGISYDQSSDWQKLADVPEAEFEDAMAQPDPIGNEARSRPHR
jgi:hypothetical protein